jgi:hypothetical protein
MDWNEKGEQVEDVLSLRVEVEVGFLKKMRQNQKGQNAVQQKERTDG